MLPAAAFLLILLALVHSVLGERFIVGRLVALDSLPRLFGSAEFTARLIRFGWHLTTVLLLGLALLLVQISRQDDLETLAMTVGGVLFVAGLLSLVITRGRHVSWLVFFIAAGLCLYPSFR